MDIFTIGVYGSTEQQFFGKLPQLIFRSEIAAFDCGAACSVVVDPVHLFGQEWNRLVCLDIGKIRHPVQKIKSLLLVHLFIIEV